MVFPKKKLKCVRNHSQIYGLDYRSWFSLKVTNCACITRRYEHVDLSAHTTSASTTIWIVFFLVCACAHVLIRIKTIRSTTTMNTTLHKTLYTTTNENLEEEKMTKIKRTKWRRKKKTHDNYISKQLQIHTK